VSQTFRLFLFLTSFAILGTSIDAQAEPENQRRQWVKKYDADGDKRLKGKEVKKFKADHAEPYERLRKWCDKAMEKPKKEGVSFPKGEKEKKFKCKKKRFDAPYVKAWVALAKPDPVERGDLKVLKPVSGDRTPDPKPKPKPEPENPCNPCDPPKNPCE